MTAPNNNSLQFACECVSARGGYSDPWAGIAQNKLLPDGTKEAILNQVAQEPKTIAQLAKGLNLSQPSIYTHINDMMTSELLRESVEWEKRYPTERYYEPNFPVIKAEDSAAFETLFAKMSEHMADLFEQQYVQLEHAFHNTGLPERGWEFPDLTQYLYACAQRRGRKMLEERGLLPLPEKHVNGVQWVFWADGQR